MFNFVKNKILALIALLVFSFYISYFITIGLQVIKVHRALIIDREILQINIGMITLVIFAFTPLFLWKLLEDSDIPLFKETLGLRYILSEIAVVMTLCLFLSKVVFNSITEPVMMLNNNFVLDTRGKIVLIEILAIAVPVILFLYLCKKVINNFLKKVEE